MAETLPVPRSEIERFIQERGVTVCPPTKYIPPPTLQQIEKMRRSLVEAEKRGELFLEGAPGEHWRVGIKRECEHAAKRRSKAIRDMYRGLAGKGLTAEEIAHRMDVTQERVRKVLREMGIKPATAHGNANAEKRRRVREMLRKRYTIKQMAAELGVTDKAVASMMRRMGVKPTNAAIKLPLGEMLRLRGDGWSLSRLAIHYGVSITTIQRRLRSMEARNA